MNESGDYLIALAEGAIGEEHIVAELGDVLVGTHPGRTSAEEITVFESLGIAVEDLFAAEYVVAPRAGDGSRAKRSPSSDGGLVVQPLATMEATGDVVRLALRARGRSVGGEIPGRGDERQGLVARTLEPVMLPHGRLDALDGVEVPVLA